ncbi:MAG: hypothetical protein NTX86_06430 [Candidatus Dependentiae bacterium]|nr:hypothetical protein [Candidatus Dependentiae bacterium]
MKYIYAIGLAVTLSILAGFMFIFPALDTKQQLSLYQAPFEKQCKEFHRALVEDKKWGAVTQKYLAQFEQEEGILMDELFNVTGLTPAQWEQCKVMCQEPFNQQEALLAQRPTPEDSIKEELQGEDALISEQSQSTVQTLLEKFNLCPHVSILVHDNALSPVSATLRHISINPMEIDQNSLEAITCHEIQHILHNDCYIRSVVANLNSLGMQCSIDEAWLNSFMSRLCKFQETRADILASLVHPQYALDISNDLLASMDEYHDFVNQVNSMHPSHAERDAYLKVVHQEIVQSMGVIIS